MPRSCHDKAFTPSQTAAAGQRLCDEGCADESVASSDLQLRVFINVAYTNNGFRRCCTAEAGEAEEEEGELEEEDEELLTMR